MKKFVFAIVTLALIVPATLSAANLSSNADFKAKCSICHGANGEGKPALSAPAMKDAASMLTTDEIVATISKGRPPKMKPFEGKLTPNQINALAAAIKAQK
jgi:mono/diheme cytochrome c family protein